MEQPIALAIDLARALAGGMALALFMMACGFARGPSLAATSPAGAGPILVANDDRNQPVDPAVLLPCPHSVPCVATGEVTLPAATGTPKRHGARPKNFAQEHPTVEPAGADPTTPNLTKDRLSNAELAAHEKRAESLMKEIDQTMKKLEEAPEAKSDAH